MDKPVHLSDQDIERITTRLSRSGASVTVQDPRVSGAFRWLAGIFATIVVMVMVWVASSINRLNETLARVATQNEALIRTMTDHSDRLRDLERRNAQR
jgi:hypothetical protein